MGPPIRSICSQPTTPSAKEDPTDCAKLEFQGLREVVGDFKGGSSEGGALLLREADRAVGLTRRLASCFADCRAGSASSTRCGSWSASGCVVPGYEDLNDHDKLRDDSLLALAVGRADLTGENRVRERDQGHPLAGHPEPA